MWFFDCSCTCMHTLHSHAGEENYSRAVRLFVFPLAPFPFQRASDGREVCKQCWHEPSETVKRDTSLGTRPNQLQRGSLSVSHTGNWKWYTCQMGSGDESSRTQVRGNLEKWGKVNSLNLLLGEKDKSPHVVEPFNEFLKTIRKPAAQDIVTQLKM